MKSTKSPLILIILFLLIPAMGSSQTSSELQIQGLRRTHENTIRNFLWPYGKDAPLRHSDVQDLQNLSIFESVKKETPKTIKVKERWTTIPIIKGQSGGGVSYKTFGVFDPNTFGHLLELGAQYENLQGRDSGVLWFRKPRLFGRTHFGGDFWNSQRPRFLYNDQAEIVSGFVSQRERYNLFVEHQSLPFFWIGFGLDYRRDQLTNKGFNPDFQQKLPELIDNSLIQSHREKLWFRFFAKLGRLNEYIPFFEGQLLNIEIAGTRRTLASVASLIRGSVDWKYFFLKGNHNFGWRLRFEGSNSKFPEDFSYVGGLDRVRGFQDGQFFGQNSIVANFEHRYRFFKMNPRWLELQGVAFTDWGQLDFEGNSIGSMGVGLRFISPKIYRFNARIDYAKVARGVGGDAISFGLQHFF